MKQRTKNGPSSPAGGDQNCDQPVDPEVLAFRSQFEGGWNFFQLARDLGLNIYDDVGAAPLSPGYYLLFSENGNFIYVGKTDDLRTRLANHFGPHEEII